MGINTVKKKRAEQTDLLRQLAAESQERQSEADGTADTGSGKRSGGKK